MGMPHPGAHDAEWPSIVTTLTRHSSAGHIGLSGGSGETVISGTPICASNIPTERASEMPHNPHPERSLRAERDHEHCSKKPVNTGSIADPKDALHLEPDMTSDLTAQLASRTRRVIVSVLIHDSTDVAGRADACRKVPLTEETVPMWM